MEISGYLNLYEYFGSLGNGKYFFYDSMNFGGFWSDSMLFGILFLLR